MSRWWWSAGFLALFALSLDYWRWDDEVALGVLGLPRWIFWLVALQTILAIAIGLFARSHATAVGDGDAE